MASFFAPARGMGGRALAAALLCWPLLTLSAEPFPARAITLVVPFPAGSTSDLIPRLMAPLASRALGVPVVVENRPGANGSLGAALVARAPADGHTLLVVTTGVMAINPWLYARPAYAPDKDFSPVVSLAATPNILVVGPSVHWRTLSELREAARDPTAPLAYASAGNGSTSHLCGALLQASTGIALQHIPYQGPAPALRDVQGGVVPMICDNLSNVLPHLRAGRLRAIAIADPLRDPRVPEVPTMGEVGQPDVLVGNWYGVVAPAGTPAPVVARLNHVLTRALDEPVVRSRLEYLGLSIVTQRPEAFKAFIAGEATRMKRLVELSGAKAE
jgi:tripartite-type tricarboxylate transporter receptor subunit TctC